MSKIILAALLSVVISFGLSCQSASETKVLRNGMVVTAHNLASQAGIDVLKKGGNAFDAAVAVQFALAVVYPRAGNIGGGGFAVIRTANGKYTTLDFREKAPFAATETMYLDEKGNPLHNKSQRGHLAVGVPGTVDGMVLLHEKYGKLKWADILKPAIDYAEKGVELTQLEAQKLNAYQEEFRQVNQQSKKMCYYTDSLFRKGDTLRNPDLARTLIRIQKQKRKGFYEGTTARLIVEEMERNKGIISYQDLQSYQSVWRSALVGEYREHTIISMPPPSSGGIALLQLLKGAEAYDLKSFGFGSYQHIHLMVELERRVYADRATWLGDPDFYSVPVQRLLSEEYLKDRYENIDMNQKTSSHAIKAGNVESIESFETTHFSIADKYGNVVAITTTLNGNYGSKLLVDGGGFFLNNEMDDFSIKPGIANQFGLVGGKANAIQPEKRMLSSMTPTIVEKDGKLKLILGSPGGSTIITSVFQNIINSIDFEMSAQEAVNAPRIHSQWLPDKVYAEPEALRAEVKQKLEEAGHIIVEQSQIGMMANIAINSLGECIGAADTLRHADSKAIAY